MKTPKSSTVNTFLLYWSYMKVIYWLGGSIVVLALGFYALNNYIYAEKQGDTSMQNTTVEVLPVSHASLVLKWGSMNIYADPVGAAEQYAALPPATIVLLTHEHGDHFSTSTLAQLIGPETTLVVPQSVADLLPAELASKAVVIKNGEVITEGGLSIQAIPMYNLREADKNRHPQGGGNGYVLEGGGTRVYIAGDTEDTPEMRALQDIDIAFVPMNLPYTMSVEQAAQAVLAFKPKTVYPYHYRGPDGLSDVAQFKVLVNAADRDITVLLADWYAAQ